MPDYVNVKGVDVAWEQFGEAGPPVLFIPSFVSHLDLGKANPVIGRFVELLAEFCRLVVYDKAGTGLSGPVDHPPTLEERVAEARTVLAAAGHDRAAIMGLSEGGPTAIMLAATAPQLVSKMVLFGTFPFGALVGTPLGQRSTPELWRAAFQARGLEDHLPSDDQIERVMRFEEAIFERWGTGDALEILAPAAAAAPSMKSMVARFERCAASPQMAQATWASSTRLDVLDVLPSVSVPTLVTHFTDDPLPVQLGRIIAERIPDARMLEMPGNDHAPWLGDDPKRLLHAVEEFLTGERHEPTPERRVMSVLFQDIVGSTETAASLGDKAWRALLEAHNEVARSLFAEHRGQHVKSLGDGFVASFDGPSQAIRCGLELIDRLAELDIVCRVGVHTGEVELLENDIGGLGVHIAARVSAVAAEGSVFVSRTVRDLVIGSSVSFEEAGEHELKGVPDRWALFRASPVSEAPRALDVSDEKIMTTGDRAAVRVSRATPRVTRALLGANPVFREQRDRLD